MDYTNTIILDGGMGQELYRRGLKKDNRLWSANALMDAPDAVREVHTDFIDAGADIITTNTYCTTPPRLREENILDDLKKLNLRACELALQAREKSARKNILIAGSLPPLYASFRPDLTLPFQEMVDDYKAMIDIMAPHVDIFLAETMTTIDEGRAAINALQDMPHPKWIAWTLDDNANGLLRSGQTIKEAIAPVYDIADALLVNCCTPESVAPALDEMRTPNIKNKPLGAYANGFSFIPDKWDSQVASLEVRKDLTPENYLDFVKIWIDKGAKIIGGCCEISPAHIKVISDYIKRKKQ